VEQPEPAFPTDSNPNNYHGMTLRDYWAVRMMESLINKGWAVIDNCGVKRDDARMLIANSYKIADIAIEVRKENYDR